MEYSQRKQAQQATEEEADGNPVQVRRTSVDGFAPAELAKLRKASGKGGGRRAAV